MTLSIIPAESYAIAMRHLDHKLDTENGFVAHTIQPLLAMPNQYVYVKKALTKLLNNIDKLREEIREESKNTDKREIILQAKLSEIEVKYKAIVLKTLNEFATQADKLRVLRTKLDNILEGLEKLISYQLKDGVMESIEKKRDKVANLNDPVPTLSQISQVLRIEELQNQNLITRWVNIVVKQAIQVFENEESDTGTIDKILTQSEEEATTEIYSLAYNRCKAVLEPNEDSTLFLNSTLKQSVAKFITATRNRNAVKKQATEKLVDHKKETTAQELRFIESQVHILETFTAKLGNQIDAIPEHFIESAFEGAVNFSLSQHPSFHLYHEFANLVVIELATATKNPELNNLYNEGEELHNKVTAKVNLDSFATHLRETLSQANAIKATASRLLAK